MEADHNSQDRRRADGPVVGLTGARFGGTAGRRRRAAAEPPEEDGVGAAHDPGGDRAAGKTGAQRPPEQQQAVPPPEIASPASEPDGVSETEWVEGAGWDEPKETYGLVRPYSLTGGRTAPHVDLALETLVSATGQGVNPADRPEHTAILRLCATPHSVAELAALLKMPLGVARVMLGDLAATGRVTVHRTAGSADAEPDVVLMRRVLTGLRRL